MLQLLPQNVNVHVTVCNLKMLLETKGLKLSPGLGENARTEMYLSEFSDAKKVPGGKKYSV